uniref:Cilia- and flagella-associated protein 263 n=1 Tax=Fundulus heteroclitus TaxID=8078 RepID=A0A3Q2PCS9_FUNHE
MAENVMFEHFIGRLGPQDREQTPQSNLSEPLQLLTLEQRLYLAQREVTETQADQNKLQTKYERILDNYKSSLKEAELRLAEIKKAKIDFECRFFKPTKDSRLEMKEPEKVLQYVEDKSKVETAFCQVFSTDAKNIGILYPLYLFFVSNITFCLSPEKLQSLTQESTELSNDITKKREMLAKLEDEIQQAEKERLKAEGINKLLRKELTDYQAPDITEYVYAKEKHKKLLQSIHHWERKVAIAEAKMRFGV